VAFFVHWRPFARLRSVKQALEIAANQPIETKAVPLGELPDFIGLTCQGLCDLDRLQSAFVSDSLYPPTYCRVGGCAIVAEPHERRFAALFRTCSCIALPCRYGRTSAWLSCERRRLFSAGSAALRMNPAPRTVLIIGASFGPLTLRRSRPMCTSTRIIDSGTNL
jgi:hypothetical protein